MIRLKLFIWLFFIGVSLPIGYVVWQTYSGLKLEEQARMQFFSETIFDRMEQELQVLLEGEENRGVEEYSFYLGGSNSQDKLSPLASWQEHPFIIGYLQNNPDNSFQTPHIADQEAVPPESSKLFKTLTEANSSFNQKKIAARAKKPITELPEVASASAVLPSPTAEALEKPVTTTEKKLSFSEKFLKREESAPYGRSLGKQEQRLETVTPEKVSNVFQDQIAQRSAPQQKQPRSNYSAELTTAISENRSLQVDAQELPDALTSPNPEREVVQASPAPVSEKEFELEVAPFQSLFIDDMTVFFFRRILLNNQMYRQGFLVDPEKLAAHLADSHFSQQPLADFALLKITHDTSKNEKTAITRGQPLEKETFSIIHTFPSPFSFLQATIATNSLPESATRGAMNITLAILIFFMLAGLTAIYLSARAIVNLAEKRSQFVSSVTHELKTPLTNIRLYIEMLQQGIAATPKQQEEYLEIIGAESTRLSGLVNNVLELSRLEQKQRSFDFVSGDLSEVLCEIETLCNHQLKQDGFTLKIERQQTRFRYDKEVMIQILLNLMENAMKFGKESIEKTILITVEELDGLAEINVSDKGPGIPPRALKRIFDNFYRVDNTLTRKTGGTGIGLSLVKKLTTAMNGQVSASNNAAGGCSITMRFPVDHQG